MASGQISKPSRQSERGVYRATNRSETDSTIYGVIDARFTVEWVVALEKRRELSLVELVQYPLYRRDASGIWYIS